MSNATNAANATIVLSGGQMIIATVNEYATIISLTIGLIGLLTGLFFHIIAVIDRRKKTNEDINKIKSEAVKEYINNQTKRGDQDV